MEVTIKHFSPKLRFFKYSPGPVVAVSPENFLELFSLKPPSRPSKEWAQIPGF